MLHAIRKFLTPSALIASAVAVTILGYALASGAPITGLIGALVVSNISADEQQPAIPALTAETVDEEAREDEGSGAGSSGTESEAPVGEPGGETPTATVWAAATPVDTTGPTPTPGPSDSSGPTPTPTRAPALPLPPVPTLPPLPTLSPLPTLPPLP